MKVTFSALIMTLLLIKGFCTTQEEKNLEYWKKVMEGKDDTNGSWDKWKEVKTMNEFEGKKILSFIRGGDYTHAGEEKAIELIMVRFPKKDRTILDVACGLGGTAQYIQSHGWGKVTGFDIDGQSIEYAKEKYPEIEFSVADVMDASKVFEGRTFDLICIVNSLVRFPDQLGALKALRSLAKEDTKLVIFDYTDLLPKGQNPLVGQGPFVPFLPIRPGELQDLFDPSGWKCIEKVFLDAVFEEWYKDFLHELEAKKEEVDKHFGPGASEHVKAKYSLIYHHLKNNQLGGCILVLTPI